MLHTARAIRLGGVVVVVIVVVVVSLSAQVRSG